MEAGIKQSKTVSQAQGRMDRPRIGMQIQGASRLSAANFVAWAQRGLQERPMRRQPTYRISAGASNTWYGLRRTVRDRLSSALLNCAGASLLQVAWLALC
jgi:hypothetical protein